MCRFAFYLGPELAVSELVTEPVHSIINQSVHALERQEPLNGDGFGIGWYDRRVGTHPAIFKEIRPAWSSTNLTSLAPFALSHCILAHVRAASSGLAVTQPNCHPFACGAMSLMHNGAVGGYLALKRELLDTLSDRVFHGIRGSTDSELVFALILDRLDTSGATLDQMAAAVLEVIEDLERRALEHGIAEPSQLNLVLTDGEKAVLSRYGTIGGGAPQTLYALTGGRFRCRDGVGLMEEAEGEQCILFASEPLSRDSGWEPVPANQLVRVDGECRVDHQPIECSRRL